MMFATLNGYAFNDSIRLTFTDPEAVEVESQSIGAEPTRVVFASGAAVSQAVSTVESTRTARMSPEPCGGEAVAPAVGAWRVMSVEASGVSSEAVSAGAFTRLAFLTPQQITVRAEARAFEPLRLARPRTEPQVTDQTLNGLMLNGGSWVDARSKGSADTALASTTLATRLIVPETTVFESTAKLAPLAYDLTRWMTPRPARTRAISYVKEGRVFRIKVEQRYATGAAIARARSRGMANAILAFSITHAEASLSLDQGAVKIARHSEPGRATAESLASGAMSQDHSARGQALGTATAVIAPDVTLVADGVRYAYTWGHTQSNAASSRADAVRWPMVTGVRQPAWAEMGVVQTIDRDMDGRAEAIGASMSDPQEAIVTHAVWVEERLSASAQATPFEPTALRKMAGPAEATSVATGEPWHWVAVAADGVAEALAEAWGDNPRIYTDGAGVANADAVLDGDGRKIAYLQGVAPADGATLGVAANVTRHMTSAPAASSAVARSFYPRVTVGGQPALIEGLADLAAEAHNATVRAKPEPLLSQGEINLPWAPDDAPVGARPIRLAWASLDAATARAGVGRNVFKINAGSPAPARRALVVPYADRRFALVGSSREYRIR